MEPLYTVGGNLNWCNHYGKQYEVASKTKIELPYDPVITLQGTYTEKTIIQKDNAFQCSLEHYLQEPRHGSNLNIHQ